MPPDEEWTEELAEQYDEIRKYFIAHPDPACIPLFLNSYGEIDGLGVYQLVDNVFEKFEPNEVIPHLIGALSSKHKSVRYWTSQICLHFPDERLIEPVIEALKHNDEDTRYFCYNILGFILEATDYNYATQIEPVIDKGLGEETYQELIELLTELKENIKKNGC